MSLQNVHNITTNMIVSNIANQSIHSLVNIEFLRLVSTAIILIYLFELPIKIEITLIFNCSHLLCFLQLGLFL